MFVVCLLIFPLSACSGEVHSEVSVLLSRGHVISERVHHKKTGSSHSTLNTVKPVRCLSISVPHSLNADLMACVGSYLLTCISMRGMEKMIKKQEILKTTKQEYNILSYQMDSVNRCMRHSLISLPRATLTDSTWESETLAPVLTFSVFKSTTLVSSQM